MQNSIAIKFFLVRHYWWMFGLATIFGAVYFLVWSHPIAVALPVLGSLLSLFFFVQKQKLEELHLFRALFSEFNDRYDNMNEGLMAITNSTASDLDDDEKSQLVDYFNLCGEEYFYYSRGYIDPQVWEAWENGMRYYLRNPKIERFWQEEKATNSYYGLPL